MSARVRAITASIRAVLKDPASPREVALLAAALAYWHVQATAAVMRRPRRPPAPDVWITPKDAAARLAVHRKWLDRRWRRLPFCHPLDPDDPGSKGYRVSERELVEHMKRRAG